MKIVVLQSFDEAESVWRMFEQSADGYPFQTFDFLFTWYRTVGLTQDIHPCIVIVFDDDATPMMLLPLAIRRRASLRFLVWLGGRAADYKAPLIATDFSERLSEKSINELWRDIELHLPAWDTLCLDAQPELIGCQPNPLAAMATARHPSSAHHTQLGSDFEAFLKSKRSAKSRSTLRRKHNNLRKYGETTFVLARDEQGIEEALETLFEQKQQNLQELGAAGTVSSSAYRHFYRDLAVQHCGSGFVNLSTLVSGNERVAAHWGLVYRNVFYFLLPSYTSGELRRYSPGSILLQYLFEWSFANNVKRFDFTVGDEQYKDHWCDVEMQMHDRFDGTTIAGAVTSKVLVTATKLKRLIKTSETGWRVASRIRSYIGNVRASER